MSHNVIPIDPPCNKHGSGEPRGKCPLPCLLEKGYLRYLGLVLFAGFLLQVAFFVPPHYPHHRRQDTLEAAQNDAEHQVQERLQKKALLTNDEGQELLDVCEFIQLVRLNHRHRGRYCFGITKIKFSG